MRPHLLKTFLFAIAVSLVATSLRAAEEAPETKAEALPRVLLLGDSISIGYTKHVQTALKGEAAVIRPTQKSGKAENCAGTTNGVVQIDKWLKLNGGGWDVIHFNFGLHDLKAVDPKTGQASSNPQHPRQASPEVYEAQLRKIVAALKKTDAKLIFATTTPVPKGNVRPHRSVTAPSEYNAIAAKVMKENGIAINDLYTFANKQLDEIQRPANVHFTPKGSAALGDQVVIAIREAIKQE